MKAAESILTRNEVAFYEALERATTTRSLREERQWLLLQAAADFASRKHPGFFRSAELETLIEPISTTDRGQVGTGRQIVVMSQAYESGGHTRFAWRWIEQTRLEADLVLTSQAAWPVPLPLRRAVESRHGRIEVLDATGKGFRVRAERLAKLTKSASSVVLFTHPWDVVARLAISTDSAPTVCLNHNDYNFSMPTAVVGAFADIRRVNQELTNRRRGVPVDLQVLVPVPLDVPVVSISRAAARHELGLKARERLVVTVAAPWRYRPLAQIDFLRMVEQVLSRSEDVVVHAVGATPNAAWAGLSARFGGRLHALGLQPALEKWHAAADVFLECVPWGSYTAALEFAVLGCPVVTFRPIDPTVQLRSDDPTAFGVLLPGNEHRLEVMAEETLRLAGNPREARTLGESLAHVIRAHHVGGAWSEWVEAACERAGSLRNRPLGVPRLLPKDSWDYALATIHETASRGPSVDALALEHATFATRSEQLRLVGEALFSGEWPRLSLLLAPSTRSALRRLRQAFKR